MKNLFFTFLALVSLDHLFAQNHSGSEISIGVEGGLPLSTLKETHKFGFGGTVKYACNLDETIALTLQSGYIVYPGKSFKSIYYPNSSQAPYSEKMSFPNLRQIPLKAGARFSFGNIYLEPQLGVSFTSTPQKSYTEFDINKTSNTAFTYAGNIGIFATKEIDISARYEGFKMNDRNVSIIGLRVGYNFSF
ncbi:outer membrane beta-barrel protein [Rhizosphaericola mali]|uniref:Outer membrane beta-barrel protein n=1 Tax=Rhizosphaericola mali TaxID=2545455 RepID=A0A5P2FZ39_9BACT|nr:outer membrane beta-barrel protein [Rhizosphaericola mali]QES88475.1 outer membrane beta-barrel protein [Rhizosphaericola mali]